MKFTNFYINGLSWVRQLNKPRKPNVVCSFSYLDAIFEYLSVCMFELEY